MRKIRPAVGIILALAFLTICFTPQARTMLSLPSYQRMVVGESNQIAIELPALLSSKVDLQVIRPTESVLDVYKRQVELLGPE